MTRWINTVARNMWLLTINAFAYGDVAGLKYGLLWWQKNNEFFTKLDGGLVHFYELEESVETNLFEFVKDNNNEIFDCLDKVSEEIKQLLKVNPATKREELKQLYEKYKQTEVIMLLGYDFSILISEYLKKVMNKKLFGNITPLLIQTPYETVLIKELKAIEEAKEIFKKEKNGVALQNKVSEITKKYGYIHSDIKGKMWTEKDYLSVIKTSTTNKKTEADFDSSTLSEKQQWLIKLAQMCVYIYEEGRNASVRIIWAMRETLKKLGENENVILNLTQEEFFDWLETERQLDEKKIIEREKNYCVTSKKGVIKHEFNPETVKKFIINNELLEFKKYNVKKDLVKGSIGYPGKAKGTVRIINKVSESNKFKKGDVLVTVMTTPDLLGLMHKAAAIVTDEGGITSHAAIIAREMKKPCVIGTKIATRVFKDGDIVEVDANKGIISKIK